MNDEFQKWFHELESFSLRSERFYLDIEVLTNKAHQLYPVMSKWMEAAFEAGSKSQKSNTNKGSIY